MWAGKAGSGTIAVSPGPSIARHMWLKPSFEPIVAMTSVSGSSSTPYFFLYFFAASFRRPAIPLCTEYRWLRGSRAASASLSTTTFGVGSVGLPMPRSMMSTPATRLSYFILLMRAKRYGGRREMGDDGSILNFSLMTVSIFDCVGPAPNPPQVADYVGRFIGRTGGT